MSDNDELEDLTEPEELPEEIIDWQPTHRRSLGMARAGIATGGAAALLTTVGALAIGAFAIGAVAFGAVAIGRLAVGSAKFRRLEIDELVVGRLRVKSPFRR